MVAKVVSPASSSVRIVDPRCEILNFWSRNEANQFGAEIAPFRTIPSLSSYCAPRSRFISLPVGQLFKGRLGSHPGLWQAVRAAPLAPPRGDAPTQQSNKHARVFVLARELHNPVERKTTTAA
ncbi:hypothetical protein [Mangrovimicrobium sediminis]|uniref:hypothetical protein n=1 Tax=Mangrovimicrobium sediminis TaxID=2562682 RepID=UPI001982049B|nr:hypothetical protein [Haliea sp. SAOS-164]